VHQTKVARVREHDLPIWNNIVQDFHLLSLHADGLMSRPKASPDDECAIRSNMEHCRECGWSVDASKLQHRSSRVCRALWWTGCRREQMVQIVEERAKSKVYSVHLSFCHSLQQRHLRPHDSSSSSLIDAVVLRVVTVTAIAPAL
jgi:hypothetical protein